jgi:hypothetical protein
MNDRSGRGALHCTSINIPARMSRSIQRQGTARARSLHCSSRYMQPRSVAASLAALPIWRERCSERGGGGAWHASRAGGGARIAAPAAGRGGAGHAATARHGTARTAARARGPNGGIGRRAVVDSATRAREFGGMRRCDANKLATKSGLPCQRKHAEIRREKARKEGGSSAFARFCSLLCDGRTECMQRPYLSSASTFVSSPDAGSLFFVLSPPERKHARAASNSCVRACMRVSEGMCAARTSSLQSHYIIVSIVVQ